MTKNKKIILLFACLSLLICIGSTAYTYAKYFSQTKRDIGTNIKKWNIKINNIDVKNGTNLTEGITATFTGSQHIADNTMAPSSEGFFYINLDYSNVEVSFKYEISIEPSITVPDITIDHLEVDGVNIEGGNTTITNTIDINNDPNEGNQEIKVFLKWKEDLEDGAIMSNEEDTQVVINNQSIDFNINLKFTQVLETT